MPEVFISYSSLDKNIADAVCHSLEENCITCWIAPRDVIVGQTYPRQIMQAIKCCKVVVLIFSENSNKSEHVENEIDKSFNYGKPIIPFIIDKTEMNDELGYYLGRKHWLIAYPDYREKTRDLVISILRLLGRKGKTDKDNNSHNSLVVDIHYIKTKEGLNNLISEFTSINGSFKPNDLNRIIRNAKEVAYANVPIINSSNRMRMAMNTLARSLESGANSFDKMALYLKFSEHDSDFLLDEMNEVRQYLDKWLENTNIEWSLGFALSGIRSELFVIISKNKNSDVVI